MTRVWRAVETRDFNAMGALIGAKASAPRAARARKMAAFLYISKFWVCEVRNLSVRKREEERERTRERVRKHTRLTLTHTLTHIYRHMNTRTQSRHTLHWTHPSTANSKWDRNRRSMHATIPWLIVCTARIFLCSYMTKMAHGGHFTTNYYSTLNFHIAGMICGIPQESHACEIAEGSLLVFLVRRSHCPCPAHCGILVFPFEVAVAPCCPVQQKKWDTSKPIRIEKPHQEVYLIKQSSFLPLTVEPSKKSKIGIPITLFFYYKSSWQIHNSCWQVHDEDPDTPGYLRGDRVSLRRRRSWIVGASPLARSQRSPGTVHNDSPRSV